MSKAKPTPAPWVLRGWSVKHDANNFRICIVEQPDKGLRQFGGGDYDDMMAECKANAELIASAPMLAHANVQQAVEIKALAARLAEAKRGLETIAMAAEERVAAVDSHINSAWVASVARETLHKARATDSAPAVTTDGPPFEWRRIVLPCHDCGVDRNTEQHKPECRHVVTNSVTPTVTGAP